MPPKKMTSTKIKNREKILDYLRNPENEWITRKEMSEKILGCHQTYLYKFFTTDELDLLEAEALLLRRKQYPKELVSVDKSMLKKARSGDTRAAKLIYERIEGLPVQKHELTGKDGGPIEQNITEFPPEPDSLAAWEQMIKNGKRPKPEEEV